jgi:hypothetical protein
MTLARLLAAALLLYSTAALAQAVSNSLNELTETAPPSKSVETVVPDPWKLVPNLSTDFNLGRTPPDRPLIDPKTFQFQSDGHALQWKADDPLLAPGSDGQTDADTTCYTIRSYVVARDSKDSDSTHPAGYSTCRRATRYHLKAAVGQPVSADR